MKKHGTRLLSGFLSLVMVLTLLPAQVLADEYAAHGEREERQAAESVNPFTDVRKGDWFYDAVLYAYANGFFSGTSTTTYEPNASMTRAMFVTVLGRMAGIDPADYVGPTGFADVPEQAWYAPYVKWAVRFGITLGAGNGAFSPDAEIDRAQMAVFFVRYFELFHVAYETGAEITAVPADLASVPDYAKDAVRKLWRQGLLNGDGVNFAPDEKASRAQVATLSQRVDKSVQTWYSEPGVPSERESVDPEGAQQPQEEKKTGGSSGGSSSGGGSLSSRYTLRLEVPNESTSTLTQTTSTLDLDALGTPKQEGYYFLGWYYDAAYTRQAMAGDTLHSESTTLYAKMLKSGEIETSETPYFTVATDVADSFTITVKSGKPDEDLTGRITLSGPEQYVDDTTDEMAILTVTRSADGTTYTLSGPNNKLAAGGSYQVVLEDDALTFAEVEEASIREYHFTVKQGEPVMNLRLNGSVKEIPIAAIRNGSQIAAQSLSPMNVQAGESGGVTTNTAAAISDTTGTFTYDGALNLGDTVAIYEGGKPSERGAETDDLGGVSYVTITGKNGNEYTYTAATAEEVLFIPDVLPVKASYYQSGTGSTVTVPVSEMTYTQTNGNLGPDTAVDVGDFLAFYTGSSVDDENAKIDAYGCITRVSESGENYVIEYRTATEEDVESSMDFSTKNNVGGDKLLAGADIQEMEKNIAQQAIDSGFAQIAAQNLAAAVSLMDLSELESGELDLSGLDLSELTSQDLSFGALQSVSAATYAEAGGGGGSGPEVKVESVRAQISRKLEHFENQSGVRIALEMKVSIEFDAGEENESITIELTPTFVQELKLDISSDGGIVWKRWFIFRYMYDIYASVSVDMYTYTSINLNATISSGGEEDTPTKVKKLVNDVKGVVKDLSAKFKGENIEVTQGISELQDLYCQMLENDTEWITLYRKNINEQKWNVAAVINITLTIDFVVQANVNVSLGLEFDYTNAKRYHYTVYIFHGKSTNNTINLIPESYNLQLYAMGVLGIRAGVEVSLSVALIHKSVAAVGVVVNVGAYLKVYGYVIYKLEHVADQPNKTSGSGALYIEVGCYLDIGMDLSAFGGKLSWKPTLYANEWPLWTAGSTLAVAGFAAVQEDDETGAELPMAYMRKGQTSIEVPGELLTMAGFDMRTGADAEQKYDVSLFDISFSDNRFKLKNGKITLDFGGGVTWQTYPDRELECDMTITWKGAPLSFNTETMQLKTKVHWDQYEEYSYAFFDVRGADKKLETRKLKSTDTLTIPEMTDDDHPGYYFRGWTVERLKPDGTLETLTPTGNTVQMLGYDLRLTANWEAKTDIGYWIQPMFQQLDGTYVKGEAYEKKDGRVDIGFAPTLDAYDGYVTPDIGDRHRIKADGTSVITANYPRQQYSFVRYLYENGSFMSGAYLYGDTIDWTPPARDGYTFTGWTVERANGDGTYTTLETSPLTMPPYALRVTANWTKNTDTPYTVKLYLQNEDGTYTLDKTVRYQGETQAVAKPTVADASTQADTTFELPTYAGYTIRDNCRNITVTINGNGTGSANYYYDLNRLTLTLYHKSDNGKVNETEWVKGVGTTLGESEKAFTGYTLAGYYTDEACTAENKVDYPTALTADRTLYAKWEPNAVRYTVEHYQQNLEGGYPTTPTDTQTLNGKVDETVMPTRKSYDGFTAPEATPFTLKVTEGDNVIRYAYTRKSYQLKLELNGGTGSDGSGTLVPYGTPVAPDAPARKGWSFEGWYTDSGCTEQLAASATMPAQAWTLYAKWEARNGIAYTVEHYQQNAAGENYTKADTDSKTGKAGAQTEAEAKNYTGFTLKDSITQQTIEGDGSTVVKLYYDRQSFPLTYDLNAGSDTSAKLEDNASATATYRHGASVTMPIASRNGYSFNGWYTDAAGTTALADNKMPMEATTLYAKWEAGSMTYTVKHYQQGLDGSYPTEPTETTTGNGNVDTTATPQPKTYSGFTSPTATTITLKAQEDQNVVEYKYARNQYTLKFDSASMSGVTGLDANALADQTVYYGAAISAPDMTSAIKTGCEFDGWYTDAACTKPLATDAAMPAAATTLYAKWKPITYTLRFNPDGNLPLKTWLLSQEGATVTLPEADSAGSYGYGNNWGMPYIDIPVTYGETFDLPGENDPFTVNGTAYTFSEIGVQNFYYGENTFTNLAFGASLSALAETDGDVVMVGVTWQYLEGSWENPSTAETPAKIYSASQLWTALTGSSSSDYPYSELMVDLEINNNQSRPSALSNGVSNGCFNGNGHTIKALSYAISTDYDPAGTFISAIGSNFTVKNVTLDGFTLSYARMEGITGYYHNCFGGLFGKVGDSFTMEKVTVKDLTMTMALDGSISEYTTVDKDYVGGLIGCAAGSVTLKDCTVTGLTMNVTVSDSSTAAVGSLIGYAGGAVTMENCDFGSIEEADYYGTAAALPSDPAEEEAGGEDAA